MGLAIMGITLDYPTCLSHLSAAKLYGIGISAKFFISTALPVTLFFIPKTWLPVLCGLVAGGGLGEREAVVKELNKPKHENRKPRARVSHATAMGRAGGGHSLATVGHQKRIKELEDAVEALQIKNTVSREEAVCNLFSECSFSLFFCFLNSFNCFLVLWLLIVIFIHSVSLLIQ